MRRISSHLLSTPCGLEPGRVVTLSDEGTITDISTPAHLDREAGVEFFSGILVPGILNAHCHLELSHLKGTIPPGGGFTGFARGMANARNEGAQGENSEKKTAAFWDARMWDEGVSTVADICNGDGTFDLKTRSRIKYRNHCELFGLYADPAKIFALCDRARAAGLDAAVTPHSTYSLNRDAFAAAVDGRGYDVVEKRVQREYGTHIFQLSGDRMERVASGSATPSEAALDLEYPALSIHFMESEQESDLFHRRGPLWDWYSERGLVPDFLDYGSPAERLVAQVPPDRPVMLVHNCLVTQRDIDIVMEHFTAPVTWVLCPGSNRYISGLAPPVDLLRRNGLRIAVGTDSLASGETLSMMRELSMLKGVPLSELLGWAAADTIEIGRAPGFVLLTGIDFEKMTLTDSVRSQRII